MSDVGTERKPKGVLYFTDLRDRRVEREFNYTVDVRDIAGLAGVPHVLMAANPHLSSRDISLLCDIFAAEHPEVERPESWIRKRRWMYRRKGETDSGPKPHADMRDVVALRIIGENPKMSARNLSRMLKERGIQRGKDWVQRWRKFAMDNAPE